MKTIEARDNLVTRSRRNVRRRQKPGIVLRGAWSCDPRRVTLGEVRGFLAEGFAKLRDVANDQGYDEDDRRRLFEVAFTLLSEIEQMMWHDLQEARTRRAHQEEEVELCEEDRTLLKEIDRHHRAQIDAVFSKPVEEEPIHEEVVSSDIDQFIL
jgi:hypothetical protein